MTSWECVRLTTPLLWKRKSQATRFKLLKFIALLQNTYNKSRLPLLASEVSSICARLETILVKLRIIFLSFLWHIPNKNTGHKQESSKFTMLKPVAGEQTATQKHVYNGGRSVHSSGEIWKWGWRQNIDTGTERDFSVLSPLRHNLTNNYTLQEGTISVYFGDYMVSLVRKLVAVIVLFMGKVPSYFKLPPAPSVSWVGNYPTLTLPTGKSQTTQPSTQSLPHYKRSSAIYG
jgi:hypothetical protein